MFQSFFLLELRYHLRRPVTLLYFAVLFLLAFFFVASDAIEIVGRGRVLKNAPYVLSQTSALLALIGQVITAGIVGTAILRDFEMRTAELMFTTRATRTGYLAGKLLGGLTISLLVYLALPIGALVGSLAPWVDAEQLHPITLWWYIQPYLMFVVPIVVLFNAFLFAAGALTRNQFGIYVTAMLLLVGFAVAPEIVSQDREMLSNLLDATGLRALTLETRYWTIAERNQDLVSMGSWLLPNRALWGGIALAVIAMTFATFRLRLTGGSSRKRKAVAEHAPAPRPTRSLPTTPRGAPAGVAVTTTTFGFVLRSMLRSNGFRALMVIAWINVVLNVWFSDEGAGGLTTYILSGLAAEWSVGGVGLFVFILAAIYGGDLAWRDRTVGAAQLIDATPAPTAAGVFGRFLALSAAMAILQGGAAIIAIVVQLLKGSPNIALMPYLVVGGGAYFMSAVVAGAMAMLIHAVVNHRGFANALIIVYWVALAVIGSLGVESRLLQIGSSSNFQWSDMVRVGPFWQEMAWLNGYLAGITLLLVAGAYLFWIRGTDGRGRLAQAGARLREGSTRGALLGGLLITTAFGGWGYQNMNRLNVYRSQDDSQLLRAQYEKTYGEWFGKSMPKIVSTEVQVDLVPEERSASVAGTYWLLNKSGRPLDSVMVETRGDALPRVRWDTLSFSRSAELLIRDTVLGVFAWRLAEPLAAGDSVSFRFRMHYKAPGFPNGRPTPDLLPNGTFLGPSYFPSIGYAANEIQDLDTRREQGLGDPRSLPAWSDSAGRANSLFGSSADFMRFSATLSTAPDQIAIAPGYLVREWEENGRRWFRYEMDTPILAFLSVLSARWEVTRDSADGVALEVYSHIEHPWNVSRMIASSRFALEKYGEWFGEYQHRQYRILEFPRYQGFAQSFPNTVPYSEAIGFAAKVDSLSEEDLDFPWFVTAHELAHQWWAHQVTPSSTVGGNAMSEALAEYSALAVTEERYGTEVLQKFLRNELNGYLGGRAAEQRAERPLFMVESGSYIWYQKGSLAFFAFRDYVGKDALHSALHRFVERWRLNAPPFPTMGDLLTELRAVTPDSLAELPDDLFTRITLYDLVADSAWAEPLGDTAWAVSMAVRGTKLYADSLGNETEAELKLPVDIGVFGEKTDRRATLGPPLHVRKERLTNGTAVFRWTVRERPVRAGIDPYTKLIDRNPADNVVDVNLP